MKTLLFSLLLALSLNLSYGQKQETVSVNKNWFNLVEEMNLKDQFLDSLFYKGRVFFKDGNFTEAYLNYNIITNGILFLNEDNAALQLVGLSEIESISYGKRTFIPINQKEVAELIETYNDESMLLLQRKSTVKNLNQYRGAYGTSTVTSSVTRINEWNDQGAYIPIDRTTEVEITQSSTFYLKKEEKISTIKNLRSLRRIYPDRWEALKEFSAQRNLKGNVQENLVALIRFCTD